jgi:hypothetical protein
MLAKASSLSIKEGGDLRVSRGYHSSSSQSLSSVSASLSSSSSCKFFHLTMGIEHLTTVMFSSLRISIRLVAMNCNACWW